MVDTVRTLAELQTLLADNNTGNISAQDVRDVLVSQDPSGWNSLERTDAEIAAGVTPTDFSYPPLNVKRYGAVADGVTNSWQAITNAIAVSDQAYFGGDHYTLVFPPNEGTNKRYMVSQQLVINRNGTVWTSNTGQRRQRNAIIAFTAAATDTTLIHHTGETAIFQGLTFQGFSISDKATRLIDLNNGKRFPTASEVTNLGLDAGTTYRFEDVDVGFIDCVFQWGDVAVYIEGRGLSLDGCEVQECTVGVDLERASDFQIGENTGQDAATGLRAYAIRDCRFHGMGLDSAAIRNVGTQKANFTGLIFTGNYIDTFCTVMYGPMQNARFDCVHQGIRTRVFDAWNTIGPLGDASGSYIDVQITGTYNCRTWRADSLSADNFLYAAAGKNISINASIRDVFKDVIRFEGPCDGLSVDGSFYDVMQDGANAWWALVKLNGDTFTNIKVAGSVQTAAGLDMSPSIVACVGIFTLTGYDFSGLAYDPDEWITLSTTNPVLPLGDAGSQVRTAAEIAAGVTPNDFSYEPLDVRRYAGANLSEQLSEAAASLPSTGGVIDATQVFGTQTITEDFFDGITVPMHIKFGTYTVEMDMESVNLNPYSNHTIELNGTTFQPDSVGTTSHSVQQNGFFQTKIHETTGTIGMSSSSLVVADATGAEIGVLVSMMGVKQASPFQESTLDGAIDDVVTTITLDNSLGYIPDTGHVGIILIDSELITFTGVSVNDLTGCVRGVYGTTATSHSDLVVAPAVLKQFARILTVSGTTLQLDRSAARAVTSAPVEIGTHNVRFIGNGRMNGRQDRGGANPSVNISAIEGRVTSSMHVDPDIDLYDWDFAGVFLRSSWDCTIFAQTYYRNGRPAEGGGAIWIYGDSRYNNIDAGQIWDCGFGLLIDDRSTTLDNMYIGQPQFNNATIGTISDQTHGVLVGGDRNTVVCDLIDADTQAIRISQSSSQWTPGKIPTPNQNTVIVNGKAKGGTSQWALLQPEAAGGGNTVHAASKVGTTESQVGNSVSYFYDVQTGTEDFALKRIGITAAETSASVTPVDFQYDPGDVRRYGAVGDGVTDDTAAFDTLMLVLAEQSPNSAVIPPLNYLITSTVDCDFLEDTTIIAYGAKFTHNANGVLFDMNPVATAAIPILTTADTWTKRRVKWLGGQFENTNGTKTASVAIQAYMMRHFVCEPEYIDDFYCGIKFAGKDHYHFSNIFTLDCERSFWVPIAGTVYTASLTGNDLIKVTFDNCEISGTGKDYGYFIENRMVGFSMRNCSTNGLFDIAHSYFKDNATTGARSYSFEGCHFEQMGDDLAAVVFDATGTNGFFNVSFDDGCEFSTGTAGWWGVRLDKCDTVQFESCVFVDGSAGSTEEGIYVDDDSRRITITQSCRFTTFAAGQEIVLETATNRQHINIQPNIVKSETPDVLTNYNGDSFSDATTNVDMSTEFADFGNFLLPPKGYEVTLTARDSGSAAAGADAVEAKLGKPSAASDSLIAVWLAGVGNDFRRAGSGFVPADENGDIELITDASGASTMDVWIAVSAVIQ